MMKITTVLTSSLACLLVVTLTISLIEKRPIPLHSVMAQTSSCYPTDQLQDDHPYPPSCSFAECLGSQGNLFKEQTWSVFFPGDPQGQQKRTTGYGKCSAPSPDSNHCWPQFRTPVKSNRLWKQEVLDGIIESTAINPSGSCRTTCGWGLSFEWRVRPLRSDCGSSGGGSGGGGTAQCGPGTGSYCFYSSNGASCNPGTFAFPPCCCFWSPIVIDISRYWDWTTNSGTGYQFTDAAGGVRFDLDGNGILEQVAWPTATSENAWLALDRNGNGVIESGKELFGNFTDQVGPNGEAVPTGQGNGWQALAEFDRGRSGGNDNGIIDSGDAAFQNLRLWVDRNHNGISESNELITLQSIGLTRIELWYGGAPWTDQYGNNFRLKGRFIWGDLGEEPYVEWYKDAWDVFPLWTP